jgi:hypothetical protein
LPATGHWSESTAEGVLIQSGHNHASSNIRKAAADLDNVLVEQLRFIDADDFRANGVPMPKPPGKSDILLSLMDRAAATAV